MPWILQMVYFAVIFIGIAFALWVGIWVLLTIFILGILIVLWTHARAFLVAKGILNPIPGLPDGVIIEEETLTRTTIIDGDYTRVTDALESEAEKKDAQKE